MSAAEVIEEIRRLPREERRRVFDYLQAEGTIVEPHAPQPEVSEEFKRLAADVFRTNAELFSKLAQ